MKIELALKMDDARAADLYSAVVVSDRNDSTSRKVVVMALKARRVSAA